MIDMSRVIARGKRIRDIERLVRDYGGKASQWVKKSSPRFEDTGREYEYHWYEHHGIGRRELKKKMVGYS